MLCSSRSLLALLAFVAAATPAHAAGKPAHHGRPTARHVSHTKTIRYRRPAVHRRPVQRAPHRATHIARRPAVRAAVRTAHRYSVHRGQRFYSRYFPRPYRYHRRYAYAYYPGRYGWRTNYYNRGYNRSRRHFSRGVLGIVETVQGNAGNGMVLVKVVRPHSRRFRYGVAGLGASASSQHRFQVNNATRYEILSVPPQPATFASLHKGEAVLILKRGNQSNIAQKVELFPRFRR